MHPLLLLLLLLLLLRGASPLLVPTQTLLPLLPLLSRWLLYVAVASIIGTGARARREKVSDASTKTERKPKRLTHSDLFRAGVDKRAQYPVVGLGQRRERKQRGLCTLLSF